MVDMTRWTDEYLEASIKLMIYKSFSDRGMSITTFEDVIKDIAKELTNELWKAKSNGDSVISANHDKILKAKEDDYKTKLLNIINKINDNIELFSLQAENEKFRQQLERISNIANNPLEPIQYNDK